DQAINLRVKTPTTARLIRLAVVVRKPLRGPVVPERVDLGHVLRRDHGADLKPLARRAAREGHREVHDQALDARPLDLPHPLPPRVRVSRNPRTALRFRRTWPTRFASPPENLIRDSLRSRAPMKLDEESRDAPEVSANQV